MIDNKPRAWVGSLAAYNNGTLIGDWFDYDAIPTEAGDWVQEMAERGIVPAWADEERAERAALAHEELWVFDHEGYAPLRKGEGSPWEFREAGEFIYETLEEGELDPFAAWYSNAHQDEELTDELVEEFREQFAGRFDSEADYARELLEETGALAEVPEFLHNFIDFERYARDLRYGSEIWSAYAGEGQVWIFRSW